MNRETFRSVGQEASKQAESLSQEGGLALGLIGSRTQPDTPERYSRAPREPSPDFDDLQAQIEALR